MKDQVNLKCTCQIYSKYKIGAQPDRIWSSEEWWFCYVNYKMEVKAGLSKSL